MTDESSGTALPLWKKVLFSLIMLGLVAAVLEGAAQVYLRSARGYAGGAFLQYQFDPYKNIHLTPGWTDTRGVTHNRQGFRRTEDVAREKEEGTFRIFLMGASTAYGLGGLFPHIQDDFAVLDNSETIDAYLEHLLSDALPHDDVEVINAGIPSIWTHHHLINLNQEILGYDPDMILFLDGFNDHYKYDRSHDQFDSYVQTEQSSVIMGPPTVGSLIRMNGWWLFRKSAFVHVAARAARELRTVLTNPGGPPPIPVDRALENVEWVFERNALRMIERNALLLQREEIPAVFLLQPLLVLERNRLELMPPIERELFTFNVGWQEGLEEFMTRATPVIADKIDSTVGSLGADFMDLTRIYEGVEGQIFTDYAHLTPLGNRILAEHVASFLLNGPLRDQARMEGPPTAAAGEPQ